MRPLLKLSTQTHSRVIAGLRVAFLLCALTLRAGESPGGLGGVETWAGRPALPALVNPVVRSPLQSVVSLRGEWEFITRDPAPLRHPGWNAFYSKPWHGSRTIQVPGCWEAQGVGLPGMGDSWDCKWDHCSKPLRWVYKGDAWYRKTLTIPENWRGKRVWLKIGGVRSQGWFWVNNTPVAWVDNYCGTYKYDVTALVEAGKPATVVAEVNNVLPSRKGLFSSTHRFGGLYRDVELEATPDARIDYAWVRGDFDAKTAEIHATVGCAPGNLGPRSPALSVSIKTLEGLPAGEGSGAFTFDTQGGTKELTVQVALTNFQAWSPENPRLYVADIVLLDDDKPVHGWTERFGVRKLEVRGDQFYLNNKPFFVRGYGDDFVYPLTLVSPASREEHLAHLKLARQAGFVYVRLHTHCELPEFFEAADEAGVLIQPELPYYGDYPTEAFAFDPIRDLKELITHYRRHVSLATYCTGNEGTLGSYLGKEIKNLIKRTDPDRLVLHQDGELNNADNSDFRNGPINVWEPGSVVTDAPFIAHEYLNLSVKQDPRLAPRFRGAMAAPVPLETRDEWLKDAGLDRRWGDSCQDAAHALQRHYQKAGLEAARMDPACDGYSFWTIVDVIVQQGKTYSAQGFLNPFWEPKPNGFSPQQFAAFNGPTALLLKTEPAERIAVAGDRVKLGFWISHYGDAPIEKGRLGWALRQGGKMLVDGALNAARVELGSVRLLGESELVVPDLPKPDRAVLEVWLGTGQVTNEWDFWLFPKRTVPRVTGIAVSRPLDEKLAALYSGVMPAGQIETNSADLLISYVGSPDVEPALALGKRVLLLNRTTGSPNVSLGWWSMGQQVGTVFARHPALGDFPHEGFLSPLAFRILKTGQKLPALSGLRPDEMFVVGEGLDSYFLYAGEGRAGQGKALITFGLDLLSGHPEGTCLLDGLIRYARSAEFDPKGQILNVAAFKAPNGWRKTLKTGDTGNQHPPVNGGQLGVARGVSGKNELVWETCPVQTRAGEQTCSVTWEGGMGYFAEPESSFELYINDSKLIDIPVISEQSTSWHNAEKAVSLRYERDYSRPEMGRFTLVLPAEMVTPGQALRLKIIGSESNSRRWVGVWETSLDAP